MTVGNAIVELFVIGRFAIIGLLATILHIGMLWLLITQGDVYPIVANLLAFLVAFLLSFTGHYYWTFSSKRNRLQALWRFLIVSGSAFMLNNFVLALLLEVNGFPPVVSAVSAAFVIPVITFILGKIWVFSDDDVPQ